MRKSRFISFASLLLLGLFPSLAFGSAVPQGQLDASVSAPHKFLLGESSHSPYRSIANPEAASPLQLESKKKKKKKKFKLLTERAYRECDLLAYWPSSARLLDFKETLIFTAGDQGVPYSLMDCVYNKLKMPSWVVARIGSTRAIDGEKTARWRGYKAFWTYHPESGLNMTVTKR